jgi:hypothetical protein
MPVFTRVAATAIVLGAAMLAAPFASAQGRPGDEISEAIHKAGAKHEPIVTKANKALIARKCGYKDEYDDRNTNIQNGTLICAEASASRTTRPGRWRSGCQSVPTNMSRR